MKTYRPTIGLEIHAELKTKSKMFCGCGNNPHDREPNELTCPVCFGHPGTLPTINKEAIRLVLKVGLALGGNLATYTEFDRKNYFYPDIPKGYQISQYAYPLVSGGELAGIAIERVHLEEDTARSQHYGTDGSLVDYNRAGVPLMELVTKPVMHSAEAAGCFARELQILLRTLGVSGARMERGEMRVEVNLSVSDSDKLGTKVEVKNINSFKAAELAVRFEEKRQIEILESGGEVIQETRGWDENRDKSFPQRAKETAHDYRYFPDPDLPKLQLDEIPDFSLEKLLADSPELPNQKRGRYVELGLPGEQIEVIINDLELDEFYGQVIEGEPRQPAFYKIAANYITSDLVSLREGESDYNLVDTSADTFVKLIELINNQAITSRVAKDLLPEVVFKGKDPESLAKERGLMQDNSAESLSPIIDQIIAEQVIVVADYKAGKESAIQFLVGQGMKLTKGSANPGLLKELLESKLR